VLVSQPIIAKASDVDEVHGSGLLGRRYSHELTVMRAGHPHARNCLVAARYHVFDVHPKVRERCEQHLEVLDHARLVWRDPRYFVALDEIISELSPETVDVTSVDEVVKALGEIV
jgi:hypothetical protein